MNSLDEIKKEISESYSWDYYKGISDNIMTLLKTYFNEHEISHPEDSPYDRVEEIYFHNYSYHVGNFDKAIELLKAYNYSVTNDTSWIRIDKGEFWKEPTLDEIRDEIEKRIERSKADLEKMAVFHSQLQNNLIEIFNSLNETV